MPRALILGSGIAQANNQIDARRALIGLLSCCRSYRGEERPQCGCCPVKGHMTVAMKLQHLSRMLGLDYSGEQRLSKITQTTAYQTQRVA